MALQAGQCVPNTCTSGAVASLGGLCLSALVGAQAETQATTTRRLWPIILGVGLALLLIVTVGLILWRWRARKRRAAETKLFKERLEREGIATGRPRLSLWHWGTLFRRNNQETIAEERRRKLREQLRYSKSPGTQLEMVDVDLETSGRVTEWRGGVTSPARSSVMSKIRSPFARLSIGTTITSSSRNEPEEPTRWPGRTPEANLTSNHLGKPVHKSPITVDASSVYSQATSRAPAMPTPKQPLKDTDIGPGGPTRVIPSIDYAPYRQTAGISAVAQFKPLIGVDGGPSGGVTGSTSSAHWQTPMSTGTSSQASSRMGDKNPFRRMV